jgi:hypothetical protein
MNTEAAQEYAERMKKNFGGPMSENEVRFLREVEGLIEFAIVNGLSFPLVVSMIGHDLNEIARCGGSLDSLSPGFRPKVEGFADLNQESVGEAEEQGED